VTSKQRCVWLPDDLWQAAGQRAHAERVTSSRVVADALRAHLRMPAVDLRGSVADVAGRLAEVERQLAAVPASRPAMIWPGSSQLPAIPPLGQIPAHQHVKDYESGLCQVCGADVDE
jgi:hypothetical protein